MSPYGTIRSKLSKMCQGNAFAFPEYATNDADGSFLCWQCLCWVVTHRRAKAVHLLMVLDIPVMHPAFLVPERQGIIKLIDLCLSLIQVAFILVSLSPLFRFCLEPLKSHLPENPSCWTCHLVQNVCTAWTEFTVLCANCFGGSNRKHSNLSFMLR